MLILCVINNLIGIEGNFGNQWVFNTKNTLFFIISFLFTHIPHRTQLQGFPIIYSCLILGTGAAALVSVLTVLDIRIFGKYYFNICFRRIEWCMYPHSGPAYLSQQSSFAVLMSESSCQMDVKWQQSNSGRLWQLSDEC